MFSQISLFKTHKNTYLYTDNTDLAPYVGSLFFLEPRLQTASLFTGSRFCPKQQTNEAKGLKRLNEYLNIRHWDEEDLLICVIFTYRADISAFTHRGEVHDLQLCCVISVHGLSPQFAGFY